VTLRTSPWSGQAAVESASIAIASGLPLRGSVRRIDGAAGGGACPPLLRSALACLAWRGIGGLRSLTDVHDAIRMRLKTTNSN
jgi:hypothetical protein